MTKPICIIIAPRRLQAQSQWIPVASFSPPGWAMTQAASALTLLGGASFECKVGRTVKRAQGVADAHGDGELFALPGAAHVNGIEQVDVQPCSRCTDTAWMLGRRSMSAADFKAIFKRQNDGFVAAVREINDQGA